jgi:hypothetical protein
MAKVFCARHVGGTRVGVLLALLGLATAFLTGLRLVQTIKNRHPIVVGCDALTTVTVANRWVQVTNCQLDLATAVIASTGANHRPAELFVPLRPVENSTGQVHAVAQTRHPILIATFLQLQRFKSPDEAGAWVSRNHEMVFPKRSITGLARVEHISNRPEWAALGGSVAEEFLVVKEGERPRFGLNGWLFGIGIGVFVVGVFAHSKGRGSTA